MNEHETDQDLNALFSAQDENFESAAFAERVMEPIQKQTARRRVVLSVAALIGGLIAGSQLPSLMSGTGEGSMSSLVSVQGALSAAQNLNPLWMASVALVMVSAFAITLFERA